MAGKKKTNKVVAQEELKEDVLYHLHTDLTQLVVCAPKDWSAEYVQVEANLKSRPGTRANEWVIASGDADGQNGVVCETDPNRRHWLLVC